MKSSRRRPDGAGGWTMTVTTDEGEELVVRLIRGPFKRNWFGRSSYYWSARVTWPDSYVETFNAVHDWSGQALVRVATRIRRSKE